MRVMVEDAKKMRWWHVVAKCAVDTAQLDKCTKLFFVFFELTTCDFGAIDKERIRDLQRICLQRERRWGRSSVRSQATCR